MSDSSSQSNVFFSLVVIASGTFVVTVLAMVATLFSDPAAPVTQFFNEHGGTLIAVEVVAILLLGGLAMMIDRWQTLRKLKQERNASIECVEHGR